MFPLIKNKIVLLIILFEISQIESSPSFYNPYYRTYQYVPSSYQYTPEIIQQQNQQNFYENIPILPPPTVNLPPLNILAESPSSISTSFTVVPMVLIAKENMNLISGGEILKMSKDKPEMTLKINENENADLLKATPAVKISLDQPILIYSVRSEILFPSNIEIVHRGYKLPIRIGTIIAPIDYQSFINNYNQGPIQLKEVFAVPAEPVSIDYVNNDKGVIIKPETDAVILEDNSNLLPLPGVAPPKNVTVLVFPNKEDEPLLIPDEEDDELVNRNPPLVLAPGGISASLQPTILQVPFENSKESFVLKELREEALKKRY